jgi:tRNA (guanine26-N2/guanine27-N2)-dimethyltransferase
MTTDSAITVPDGFTLHTENSSHILLSSNEAFLNPVQEFNRDISVACIRVWSEEMAKTKGKSWLVKSDRKKRKGLVSCSVVHGSS